MALSRAAGITQPTLSSLERGETKESFAATILGIAAALDANVTWLQTGRGDPFDTSDTNDGELEQVIADLSPKQRAMLLGIARTIKDSS